MLCYALICLVCLLQIPTAGEEHWAQSKKLTHFPNEIPKSAPAGQTSSVPDEAVPTELHNFASWSFKVESVVDPKNMILGLGKKSYWLTGYPTKGLADGDKVNLIGLVKIVEPKTFTTVLGASRTIRTFKLMNQEDLDKRMKEEQDKVDAANQQALKLRGFKFELKDGTSFVAIALENKKGAVSFYTDEKKTIKLQLNELVPASQTEVRKQLQQKKP